MTSVESKANSQRVWPCDLSDVPSNSTMNKSQLHDRHLH